jgi:hypothetical protein
MANLAPSEQLVVPAVQREADSASIKHADSFAPPGDSGNPWDFTTIVALLLLVVLWAVKFYTTWGAWGNLTIDSGHEMYVPALLAKGKLLYRDVWFMYGPAAPYFTSYLYRLFGVQLNVLYWAGALSALGSAIFLFLAGMRLSKWPAGWTAGAVVLMEAFQPSIFCFPLPYASAAVFGCLIGCLFLWLVVNACFSAKWFWMFSAGTAAAVALLLKPEFGIACYGTLALMVAVRFFSGASWKVLARDVATILPGMVLCALVIRWMVSIAGVEFITQENILSWPTSYFMKNYGKLWLALTGFTITGPALRAAALRAVPVAGTAMVAYVIPRWKRLDLLSATLKAAVVLFWAVYFFISGPMNFPPSRWLDTSLATLVFPQDMVLYVTAAAVAAWYYFWWRPAVARNPAVPLVLTFSSLLAFRILMRMFPTGYAIYCNGPVVLSFLLLICLLIPRSNRSRRFVFLGETAICLACLLPVFVRTRMIEAGAKDFVPLSTARGTIRVSKTMTESYTTAIQFMKEKASLGQSVLSVPEDTSLYFLSETECPTRVFMFIPGLVAPGKMTDEVIRQIELHPVRYLLWSNRTFSEYGAPEFGVDFDRPLGDYLKSHYRLVGPLLSKPDADRKWNADVWERKLKGEQ